MPYDDFTLEAVEAAFGLTTTPVDLFAGVEPVAVPAGLAESLAGARRLVPLVSEKARSEFLVAPVLLALGPMVREDRPLSIFSGLRLDVDEARGLAGKCDFLVARTQPIPRLKNPILTILEAKEGIIELALGPCAARMVAARLFNERGGEPARPGCGAVTTGELWQFLKLDGSDLWYDSRLYYPSELGTILGILRAIVTS